MTSAARDIHLDDMQAYVRPMTRRGAALAPKPPRSNLPALDYELIDTLAAFEALEADWNALFAAAARPEHVFQTFNWCWHWTRHYLGTPEKGPRLAIVAGRSAGRLVLLMPLVVERSAGLRSLGWLGDPVSQYGDIVATTEASAIQHLLAAWAFAVRQVRPDVANLRRVRADAVAAPLMTALGATITATEEAPFLSLAGDVSFAGWEHRRQPKARKNRRRQARRLAETGEVAFERHEGTATAAELAAHAIRLKREALGAKGAISLALGDDRFAAFFADAAHGLGRPPGVMVEVLNCAKQPIAFKILLRHAASSFLHVAVFEPSYGRCGAGALLLERVVSDAIDDGCRTLDLLPPRHEYKIDFADDIMLVHDHAIALSKKGWWYANGYLSLRRHLKGVVETMPAPVRRLLSRVAA